MTSVLLYSATGMALFAIGLLGVVLASHAMRKVLALNVMGVGVFMVLVALAKHSESVIDPVPHALVLTGIVIAVAGTALALNLIVRLHSMSKSSQESPSDD
ncbi:MAG: multicomponent Na+:H+ antiporter subunit C [Paraglaciecola sp.]|jgi:multicomponent Na+:H+ antiporter subunit C